MARCPALQVQTECSHAGPTSILSDQMPHSHQILIGLQVARIRQPQVPPLYADLDLREILTSILRKWLQQSLLTRIRVLTVLPRDLWMHFSDELPTGKFPVSNPVFWMCFEAARTQPPLQISARLSSFPEIRTKTI
jgi:hypothetical protein